MKQEQKLIGHAGEHLVMADLTMSGHTAFCVDGVVGKEAPYDILVDRGQDGFVRVQVKATKQTRVEGYKKDFYQFHLTTRTGAGRPHNPIPAAGFDVLALAFLDIRKVAYIKTEDLEENGLVKQNIRFRSREHTPDTNGDWVVEDHEAFPYPAPTGAAPF